MIGFDEKVEITSLADEIKSNPMLLSAYRDDPVNTIVALLPHDLTAEQAVIVINGVRTRLEGDGPSKEVDTEITNFLGT